MMNEQKKYQLNNHWFIIFIIANVIFLYPTIYFGFPHGHDGEFHYLLVKFFSEQFWKGDFYPRMLIDHSNGLGMPLFYISPPFEYYIGAVLSPVFDVATQTHYILSTATVFSFIAGSTGVYLATRSFTSRNASIVAGLFYSILPYHLEIDLSMRATYTELFAMGLLPFLFIPVSEWRKRGLRPFLASSIFIFLMLITHAPTSLISIPFAFIFQVYFIPKSNQKQETGYLLLSYGLGLLLASFYVFPAIFGPSSPDKDLIWQAGYSVYNNFLKLYIPNTWSFQYHLAFNVLFSVCVFFTATFLLMHNTQLKRFLAWSVLTFITCIFFMLDISETIYQNIPLLHKIQFPWRFNTLVCLLLAIQLGLLFEHKNPLVKFSLLLLFCFYLVTSQASQISAFQLEPGKIGSIAKHVFYAPHELQANRHFHNKHEEISNLISPGNSIFITHWSDSEIIFEGNFKAGETYNLRRAYFSNWVTSSENAEIRKSATGLVQVYFKNDETHAIFKRLPLQSEYYGNYVSILSLIFMLVFSFWPRTNQENR